MTIVERSIIEKPESERGDTRRLKRPFPHPRSRARWRLSRTGDRNSIFSKANTSEAPPRVGAGGPVVLRLCCVLTPTRGRACRRDTYDTRLSPAASSGVHSRVSQRPISPSRVPRLSRQGRQAASETGMKRSLLLHGFEALSASKLEKSPRSGHVFGLPRWESSLALSKSYEEP